jgi:hypothetical protein
MPGRMGHEWNTVQHLPVLKVDDENGLILVKGWLCPLFKIEYAILKHSLGCVSGPKNSIIQIYDSKKRPWQVDDLQLPRQVTSVWERSSPVTDQTQQVTASS